MDDIDSKEVFQQAVKDVIYFINGEIGLCFNNITPETLLRAMTLAEMRKALDACREGFVGLKEEGKN